MKTLGQLTKKYRSQLCSVRKIREQIDQLHRQQQEYHDQIDSLTKEISFTKILVDYCVLTGESPAEAVLKNTHDQLKIKVHQLTGHNHYTSVSPSWGTISSLNIVPPNLSITNTGTLTTSIGTPPSVNASITIGGNGILVPGV